MSRFERWDDQVKLARAKAADPEQEEPEPEPVKPEAKPVPESIELLRRIARASERTSRRVAVLEWGFLAWIAFRLLAEIFSLHVP
jgi:hypothetical protein